MSDSKPLEGLGKARALRLDRNRREGASRRARAALMLAADYEKQAAAEKAKADALCRTWDLVAIAVDGRPDVVPAEYVVDLDSDGLPD